MVQNSKKYSKRCLCTRSRDKRQCGDEGVEGGIVVTARARRVQSHNNSEGVVRSNRHLQFFGVREHVWAVTQDGDESSTPGLSGDGLRRREQTGVVTDIALDAS